ncbi:MAG: hypothetical protein JKP98_10345 [Rhodobacteraceae bacterium]|nr:hypothetical protein [Paracoccaceae bacterium]
MVLVTRDTALPATPVFNRADGNRIVAETGLPTAGFIQRDATGAPIATGAYGGWTLDLSPYSDSAVVASATDFALIDNNFAGLIAVPIHGVMSRAAGPNPSNVEDQFARCAALPDGHPLQDECYENPAVWTDMVFNQLFSDGSVRFPGIEGVYRITMTDPANFPAGNDIASIRGLTILEMSPPFSTGAISDTLDVFPQISNVSRLSMGGPVRTAFRPAFSATSAICTGCPARRAASPTCRTAGSWWIATKRCFRSSCPSPPPIRRLTPSAACST